MRELWREGEDRIDRISVEEIGQRFGLDQDEAREAFVALRGNVWEGEFIGANEEPGWEAVVLKDVPSSGSREETPIQ